MFCCIGGDLNDATTGDVVEIKSSRFIRMRQEAVPRRVGPPVWALQSFRAEGYRKLSIKQLNGFCSPELLHVFIISWTMFNMQTFNIGIYSGFRSSEWTLEIRVVRFTL